MSSSTAAQRPFRPFIKGPDKDAFRAKIDKLNAEIKTKTATSNELTAQLKKAVTPQAESDKRKELQKVLNELMKGQASIKSERNAINEQIKAIDISLKKKISDLQGQTSKTNFKSVAEIDSKIQSLDNLISTGTLKLADERRYVKEMSSLRKLRKDFGTIETQQKSIDEDKTKIAELRKKLSGVQNKELAAKFESTQKEIDEINEKNKTVTDKRSAIYNKRNDLKKEIDALYNELRSARQEYDANMKQFQAKLADEKKKRAEEEKTARLEEAKLRRKKDAEKELAEASIPAFTEEINTIHSLLKYFDPSYVKPIVVSTPFPTSSFDSKKNIRTVEMPADAVLLKKEEEIFFVGNGGKKHKKKQNKTKTTFTVESDIISALFDFGIPLPASNDDVPATIEVLKTQLTELQNKQESTTKSNIEKAKAKIAKIEAEALAEEEAAEEADKENVAEAASSNSDAKA